MSVLLLDTHIPDASVWNSETNEWEPLNSMSYPRIIYNDSYDKWLTQEPEQPEHIDFNPHDMPIRDNSWLKEAEAKRLAERVARVGSVVDIHELRKGDWVTIDGADWEYIGGARIWNSNSNTYSFSRPVQPTPTKRYPLPEVRTWAQAELETMDIRYAADEVRYGAA